MVAVFVKMISQHSSGWTKEHPVSLPADTRTSYSPKSLGQYHCTELMDDCVCDVGDFGNLVSRIFWKDVNYQSL